MSECNCGKTRYESRRVAMRVSRRYPGKRLAKIRAYRCNGGFWHLSSASAEDTAFFRTHEHNQDNHDR